MWIKTNKDASKFIELIKLKLEEIKYPSHDCILQVVKDELNRAIVVKRAPKLPKREPHEEPGYVAWCGEGVARNGSDLCHEENAKGK